MVTININKIFYSIPSTWNELNGRQLIEVIQTINRQGIFLLDAQVRLLKTLLNLTWWRMWLAGAASFDDKLYLTDFLLQENTLTKNLLPTYKGMYGPADDFGNLLICEFIFTEQNYQAYNETANNDALNSLVAILYRPCKKRYNRKRNPEGDIREPYNDNLTALYAAQVSRWPVVVKLAILHFYEGCRQKLQQDFPEPFSGGSGEESKYGLWSVMRGVAERAVHGDLKQVEKMYLKEFMMELTELMAEARRIQSPKPPGNG